VRHRRSRSEADTLPPPLEPLYYLLRLGPILGRGRWFGRARVRALGAPQKPGTQRRVPRPAARAPRLSATRAYPGHWLRAPVSPNKARHRASVRSSPAVSNRERLLRHRHAPPWHRRSSRRGVSCCQGRTASADRADGGAAQRGQRECGWPRGTRPARYSALVMPGGMSVASYRNAYGPRSTRAPSNATDARVRVTGVVVAHADRPRRRQADQPDLEGDAPAAGASLSRDLTSIAPAFAPKAPCEAAHRTARVEQRTTRLALAAPNEAVHERPIHGLDADVANGVRAADRACPEPLCGCQPLAEHAESVAARARDRYGVRRCPVACSQESERSWRHACGVAPALAAAPTSGPDAASRVPPTR